MKLEDFKNNPKLVELLFNAYSETTDLLLDIDSLGDDFAKEDYQGNDAKATMAQVKLDMAIAYPNGWDSLIFSRNGSGPHIEVKTIPWGTEGALCITHGDKETYWCIA